MVGFVCRCFSGKILSAKVLEAMNASNDGQPALDLLQQALQMEPPVPCHSENFQSGWP